MDLLRNELDRSLLHSTEASAPRQAVRLISAKKSPGKAVAGERS